MMRLTCGRWLLAGLFVVCVCGCTGGPPARYANGASTARPPTNFSEAAYDLPPIRLVDVREGHPARLFAAYGQCQIELSHSVDAATGLPVVPDTYRTKVEACVSLAVQEDVNVLILPELSLSFRKTTRDSLLDVIRKTCVAHNMVVIAGSFYDQERQGRIPVIGPGWEELGYKLKPSRFEASPRYGLGMKEGKELLLLDTVYGRIVPLTCVDLISDAAQYSVRSLATRGQVDVIANLSFNPAAWEFLIEGNSIARRHPVIVSITNVAGWPDPKKKAECLQHGDGGTCFGNSALFAGLRARDRDCPNCWRTVADLIEPAFKSGDGRSLPYDTMVAVIPPPQEGMLVYDVNLRLRREPAETNAPDQGYPVVRNVRRIPLAGRQ